MTAPSPRPRVFTRLDLAIEALLHDIPGDWRLAMPLGIGKPNPLINAIYQNFSAQTDRKLAIYTALSLLKPEAHSELEKRFLEPLLERLFGNYPDLDYARALLHNQLPSNITVHEFFLKSGDWLNNHAAQQNYISSNYTHIARDIAAQKPNLLLQAVAAREINGTLQLSLSCNPDVTLDLADILAQQSSASETCLKVAMINRALPFMPGTAEVPPDFFDVIIDDPTCTHTLFCTPNMAVSSTDYAIGLHASGLVQDGGTLQIGIGSLGDAVAHSLMLRQSKNTEYHNLLRDLNDQKTPECLQTKPFNEGLYGCSEMFVNGLLELIHAGIIKRVVTDENGRNILLHGGFFIGPRRFYQLLREMPDEQLALIDMHRISYINHLHGNEILKRQQRTKAAFINTCMMVTLGGAAVSDTLEDGRVVSGVGGQYNFVAMAHELPDARSILMLRSFRMKNGQTESNIVPTYAQCTIPRHLRDIVVTEYGIADLRGKSDAEVIAALIRISDTRFQPELREWAVTHGKLPASWEIPEANRHNTPTALTAQLSAHAGILPDFPFGHDFTEDELAILRSLEKLKQLQTQPLELAGAVISAIFRNENVPERYLDRMGFDEHDSIKTRLLRKLFAVNL